jgi:hypothetical protein
MLRAHRDVRKTELTQHPADSVLVDFDPKPLFGNASQVDAPPTHDPIGLKIGTLLDQSLDLGLVVG